MPCACRLPIETYPDATDWGPFLWAALHGAAERAGSAVTPLYAEDERRIWLVMFSLTAEIIPCATCKEHFQTYLAQHSVDALNTLSPPDMREWLRTWFWEVHNWVNGSLERPEFPFDQLTPKYADLDLRLNLKKLEQPMTTAINLSGVSLKRWIAWKNKYLMLLSIVGA
jgi:hypothetical protein